MVTSTSFGYLYGVSSDIQTQINTKQASITGGATTIATSNLSTYRALISNGSGKVAVSDVTSTELGYLDGVTSAIQTQINNAGGGAFTVSGSNTYHSGGYVGVNKTNPAERLDVNGGVKLGSAAGTANGTIQWTGSELQVRIGGVWKKIAMYGEWDALYEFTTFTFTNCGKTGMDGPTLTECRASYSPSWTDNTSYFNVTGSYNGIQQWNVPVTGTYTIDAYGAKAGDSTSVIGGYGARIHGTVSLTQGDWIHILVGQKGSDYSSCSSGGGGTFVIKSPYNSNASILIIAGGGGGVEECITRHGGETGKSGGDFTDYDNAAGGVNGYGGVSGHGQPGAGFLGDATGTFAHGGTAAKGFVNGGRGGENTINGGFGGGGAAQNVATGGGGGYSGGASGDSHGQSTTQGSGGGGSYYDNATGVSAWGNNNNGHGKVIITKV